MTTSGSNKDPVTLLLDWSDPLSYTPHPGITNTIAKLPRGNINSSTTSNSDNGTSLASTLSLVTNHRLLHSDSRSTIEQEEQQNTTVTNNDTVSKSASVIDTVPNNLPVSFVNVDDYHRIFIPLLLEEIREIARQHIPEPDVSPLYFMYDGYMLQPAGTPNTIGTTTTTTGSSTATVDHSNSRDSSIVPHNNKGKKRIVRKHTVQENTNIASTTTSSSFNHPSFSSTPEAHSVTLSSSSIHNLESSSTLSSTTSSSSSSSSSSVVTLVFSYTKRRQYEWEDEQRSKGLSPEQASLSWTSHPTNRTLVLLSPEPLALYQYRKSTSSQRWKPDNLDYYLPEHIPCPIMIGLCSWTIGDQNAARFDIQVHYEQFNKAMEQYQKLLQYRENLSPQRNTVASSSSSSSSFFVTSSTASSASNDTHNTVDLIHIDERVTNRKRRLSKDTEDEAKSINNDDDEIVITVDETVRNKKYKGENVKKIVNATQQSSTFRPISGGTTLLPINDVFAPNNRYAVPESWFCWNLANIVTGLRELSALCSIETLDKQLLHSLFQPNPSIVKIPSSLLSSVDTPGSSIHSTITTGGTKNRLKYLSPDYHKLYLMREFNSFQREAIEAALKYEGNDSLDDDTDHENSLSSTFSSSTSSPFSAITLIQGPPGTGKTTTILGLINSLHIAAYGNYYETLLGTVTLPSSSRNPSKPPSRASTPPPPTSSSTVSEGFRTNSTLTPNGTAIGSSTDVKDKSTDAFARSSTVPSSSSARSTTNRTPSSSLSVVPGVVAAVPIKATPVRTQSTGGMLSLTALLKSTEKSLLEKATSSSSSNSTGTSTSSGTSFPSDIHIASRGHGSLRYLLTSTTPIDHCLHAVASAFRLKPRILVTAPSNTAVDGIILRLVKEQLRSGVLSTQPSNGNAGTSSSSSPSLARYSPPIKRVGEACSNEVRNLPGVYIEAEVDRLLSLVQDPMKLINWQQKLEHDKKVILADLQNQRNAFQNHPTFQHWKQQQYQHQQQLISTNALYPPNTNPVDILSPLLTQFSGKVTQISEAYERTRMKFAQLNLLQSLSNTDTSNAYANQNQRNDVRRGLRNLLLEDAQIVFTTTSSAALGTLEAFVTEAEHSFPICIIDEAAQAIEPSTLIPFRYNTKQVILVGDPQQLPATIISRVALRYGLDRSLFGRLAQGNHPVHMLRVQYRSHPAISAFPSKYFYGGKLRDSEQIRQGLRYNIFHKETCFRPLLFYDCQIGKMEAYTSTGNRMNTNNGSNANNAGFFIPTTVLDTGEISTGPSFRNIQEAHFIVRLIQTLNEWRGEETSQHPTNSSTNNATAVAASTRIKFSGTVGIISFYRAQVNYLVNEISQRFRWPPSSVSNVVIPGIAEDNRIPLHFSLDINTVDGFQGQERDIIILSCVRTIKLPSTLVPKPGTEPMSEIEDGEIIEVEKVPETNVHPSVIPSIGFLNDSRRINVALTRAKYACWTVGNSNALETSVHWRAYVEHCRTKECVIPLTTMEDIHEKSLYTFETIKSNDRTLSNNNGIIHNSSVGTTSNASNATVSIPTGTTETSKILEITPDEVPGSSVGKTETSIPASDQNHTA